MSVRKRDILDSMPVLPKNSTYALLGDDQFSTRGVTETFMIGANIRCMECAHFFAVVRETFTGFSKVGSVTSEGNALQIANFNPRINKIVPLYKQWRER